ncbi:conserved membrane protein of unknown function [Candidatus Filomicrobium marinum]|uniref:DUF4239 domain-containing protein n=1 Tax=Candidatus Filomicrobium marinum TaxID=1608628 RepID=A0A0D6JB00_9HYPH|nr:DUF4239 domain-containing protein [Candidatus Filomicrobium marinum]CFW99527.1 conserved membrane protein of unknown function [Candidatus Filomicrobium marinum]CPR15066.1 conserved membrane protein of unknown function [Candidatus Filomicrobium marinum]
MELIAQLADWSLLVFALLLFVVEVIAYVTGYRLGQRQRANSSGDAEGVGFIVGGILGLLAFVLALTLSYANTRFAERRHATLEEANAIGTAWLRAQAIDHPRGHEIAKRLEEYTRERKRFQQAHRQSAELEESNKRTSNLQAEIWEDMAAISRERTDPIVAALMQALNDTFDMSTAQRFAHEAKYPPQMFWLLIGLALISVSALGYQLGLKGQKTHLLVGILIAVWTAVIVVILDISAPRIGSIRTGTAVYDWTLEGFNGNP